MEYILIQIFGPTAAKYGPFIAIAVVAAFAFVVLTAYYTKKKIDMADRDCSVREQERQALVAELGSTRAQVHSFLTNHLEHLRQESEKTSQERAETAKVLQSMADNLGAQTSCLQNMERDIIEIKGRVS